MAAALLILPGTSSASGLHPKQNEDIVEAKKLNWFLPVGLVMQWIVSLVLAVFQSPDSGGRAANLINCQVCTVFVCGGLITFIALSSLVLFERSARVTSLLIGCQAAGIALFWISGLPSL
jgi:hypothetical protein